MKPKYLVGYKGDDGEQIVGKYFDLDYVEPIMFLRDAKKIFKEDIDEDTKKVIIYKLVPVEEKKVKEYR